MQLLLETHSFILFSIFTDYFSGDHHSSPSSKQFIRTYSIHEFFYILSLFLFSLLSTSAIVFTVASLYASKSVSFIPTLFAIPRIFKHLMITFFYVFLLMIVSYLAYYVPISVLVATNSNEALFGGFSIIFAIIYDFVHIYVTAQWHLASVISVLEPNGYGLAAMKKKLVFEFALECQVHFMVKLLLGLLCLFMLVAVNLTGLLFQSVLYYACKSHHNKVVDKKVLYDHLGSYDLGDISVALNPSTGIVEMQSLVKDDHDRVGYQPVALNATTTDSTIKMQRSGKDDDMVGELIEVLY
ncbi:hypothetical protein MKW98_001838 [Papaver atlanticum]|uniref:Uncharacterized protein n=1 Tax=Papaver atlanticum TaxID=357466 RepID=A0AAD4SA51_9MAGN|nr:hypothetical protein MKW98_001838 [Papaver atlanticum]